MATRLPTEQKIPGSTPGSLECFNQSTELGFIEDLCWSPQVSIRAGRYARVVNLETLNLGVVGSSPTLGDLFLLSIWRRVTEVKQNRRKKAETRDSSACILLFFVSVAPDK